MATQEEESRLCCQNVEKASASPFFLIPLVSSSITSDFVLHPFLTSVLEEKFFAKKKIFDSERFLSIGMMSHQPCWWSLFSKRRRESL